MEIEKAIFVCCNVNNWANENGLFLLAIHVKPSGLAILISSAMMVEHLTEGIAFIEQLLNVKRPISKMRMWCTQLATCGFDHFIYKLYQSYSETDVIFKARLGSLTTARVIVAAVTSEPFRSTNRWQRKAFGLLGQ